MNSIIFSGSKKFVSSQDIIIPVPVFPDLFFRIQESDLYLVSVVRP